MNLYIHVFTKNTFQLFISHDALTPGSSAAEGVGAPDPKPGKDSNSGFGPFRGEI